MATFYAILADLIAIIHGSLGALMIWVLWPVMNNKPLRQHKSRVALGVAYVFLVPVQWRAIDGCLMTQLEKHLIKLSGHPGYDGGFLYHYFGMSTSLVTGLSMTISILVALRIIYKLVQKKEVPSGTRN
ncbi:hypothetical protein HOB10_03455 [Candidatus Parcubacteria bacterium]|mgnify:CR=1 FL=1|jgi:hypothetical protein|nr:hypothetical protein [Candidatus Parcubacteria bacterium]